MGHHVTVSGDGERALQQFEQAEPALVLLDLMLPGIDGLEVCRSIRATAKTPIIVLSARDTVQAKVDGLDAGADDYMVKPFAFAEVQARVRAALRRSGANQAVIEAGEIEVDRDTRTARRAGRCISLTNREFELLLVLAENAGRVVSRRTLQERVWGPEWESDSDPVKVYVSYLRRKLNGPGEEDLLTAVRGFGYMLRK